VFGLLIKKSSISETNPGPQKVPLDLQLTPAWQRFSQARGAKKGDRKIPGNVIRVKVRLFKKRDRLVGDLGVKKNPTPVTEARSPVVPLEGKEEI